MKLKDLYFIADAQRRYVKIGVSVNPGYRLFELQAGSPIPLVLEHVVDGTGQEIECDLHQHFASHWLHREWFSYAPEIKALVAKLKTDGPRALDDIPVAPVPRGFRTADGWLSTRDDTMRYLRDGYLGGLS